MGLFDKKESSLGGAYGSSRTPVMPEGFAEGSLTWPNVARELTTHLADSWFEDLGVAPLKECLRPGAIDADENVVELFGQFAKNFADGSDATLIKGLEIEIAELGEEIDIDSGALGPAILKVLASSGVAWAYDTRVNLGHGQFTDVPGSKLLATSPWGTYFGTFMQQKMRIFKNAAGEEVCFWSSDMLAATRPFEHIATRTANVEFDDTPEDNGIYGYSISDESIAKGAYTFGEWSTKIFIPEVAKRMFYLAETPFPSNIAAMGRQLAFGSGFPPEQMPRPVLINNRNSWAQGAFGNMNGSLQVQGSAMPNVLEFGWTFSSTNAAEIQKILEVITAGLVAIASMLEDGYLNYRTDDYPYPWDRVLLSASRFDCEAETAVDSAGLSQWVPVVRLGFLLNETEEKARKGLGEQSLEELTWIVDQGAGHYVPHAANTFVWNFAIENEWWPMIDRILDATSRMDLNEESTNSLSNWGIAKYKQGLTDEAIEKFEAALDRYDKYSEAEASYWLAEIWAQKGDAAKSASYKARCDAAGGYDPGTGFAPENTGAAPSPSPGLQKSSKGLGLSAEPAAEVAKLASFCSQCGTKFETDSAKFCAQCGSGR